MPLSVDRKLAHRPEDILGCYQHFQCVRIELEITDEDIWNMDETGFRIGVKKAQYVVSTHATKQLCINDPDNRNYIMSAECISGSEVSMALFIILNGKLILDKWANNDLLSSTKLAISDSGYSNNTLALAWLQHFEIQSCKGQKGKWRALIIDGYESHLTWEFFQYALEHEIRLFQLPAHSTHFTQLLDVDCFQPFKHYHQEALDRFV